MLAKLQAVEDKYLELESLISDPDTMQDMKRWQGYSKEHAQLAPIVEAFREYKKVSEGLSEDKEMLGEENDPEMKHLLEAEIAEYSQRKEELEQQLPILLLPKDPNDDKNVIVEIRGGVGGEEAKGHVPLVAHVAGGVTRHDREVVVGELKRGAAEEGRLRGERLEFGETRARGGEAFGVRGDLRRDGRRCGGLLAEADSGEGRGGENGCEACFFHKMDSLSNDWLYYKAK